MPHTLLDKSDHGSFARRQRVADAALELFQRKGIEETSIEEITKLAGVSERTFFRYFSSKEATVFSDHHQRVQLLTDALENRKPSSSPFVSALDVVRYLVDGWVDPKDRLRYDLIDSSRQLMDMSRIGDIDYENAIESYIKSQIADDTFNRVVGKMFAVSSVALIRTVLSVWRTDDSIDFTELLNQGVSLLNRFFASGGVKIPEPGAGNDLLILVPRSPETRDILDTLLRTATKNS